MYLWGGVAQELVHDVSSPVGVPVAIIHPMSVAPSAEFLAHVDVEMWWTFGCGDRKSVV